MRRRIKRMRRRRGRRQITCGKKVIGRKKRT